jgi:hypothetical protein
MKFLYLCFRCYVWLFAVLGTIILAPIVFVWGTVAREHEPCYCMYPNMFCPKHDL